MQAEEEEYESHFVENPFIRMRERALQRQLDSRSNLGASQLRLASGLNAADRDMEDDAEKQDIFIVKETGKFIINDLEMQPKQQPKKNLGKRTRIENNKEGSDMESSVGDNVSEPSSDEEDGDNGKLKNKLKQATKR